MRSHRLRSPTPAGLLLLAALWAAPASAQLRDFVTCTPGALADCTQLRLTATPGGGVGGTTLFEVALRNLGSTTLPALPTTVYNLILDTGLPTAAPGTEVSVPVVPVPVGGATLTDPSAWDLFENGSALFLSALSDLGVGGCVAGAPVGGFGQAGNTCGAGQLLTFTFSTPRPLDPLAFRVLDLEVVGLAPGLPGDSCGLQRPCVAPQVSTAPEPTTLALLAAGVLLGGAGRWRRASRRRRDAAA